MAVHLGARERRVRDTVPLRKSGGGAWCSAQQLDDAGAAGHGRVVQRGMTAAVLQLLPRAARKQRAHNALNAPVAAPAGPNEGSAAVAGQLLVHWRTWRGAQQLDDAGVAPKGGDKQRRSAFAVMQLLPRAAR
jgi:hypothetical protein